MNERICTNVGRDARNLQIGHAYLLEKGWPIGDFVTFARVLQDDILPLLEEYCYEDYMALEKILGSSLVDGRRQQIHHTLFALPNRDLLIQALLAPTPDILSSPQAIAAEALVEENRQVEEGEDEVLGEQP